MHISFSTSRPRGHMLDRFFSVVKAVRNGLSIDTATDELVTALMYDHVLGLPCGTLNRNHTGLPLSGMKNYRGIIREQILNELKMSVD